MTNGASMEKEIGLLNSLLPVNPTREWRDIKGYEGCYVVSSDGHVGSLTRQIANGGRLRRIRTRILRRTKSTSGRKRWVASVHLGIEGVAATFSVARLVLEAFVGPQPLGTQAHVAGPDPADITTSTVIWATPHDLGMISADPEHIARVIRSPPEKQRASGS